MKNIRFLTFVLTIATLLVSACGAVTATPAAAPEPSKGPNVDAMPVSFVGIVDSMAGDQWVISGTTVTVNPSILRDGPFNVGDRVKVEGFLNPDGSFTVSRVETPTPQETATLPPLTVDNSNEAISNSNTNDANVNDDNSNDSNTNDDNGNDANINDDNSNSANSNDDNSNAANTNDDHGNDGNSNDDHGGNNSNDDHGNDNNSGGGGNDNGGDDHGGDD